MTKSLKKILSFLLIVCLGVLGRIFFVNYIAVPNFEIVSSLALLSGFYLGGVFSFIAPLLIIFLSDLFIGNNAIIFFTWTAFGLIGLMGLFMKKLHKGRPPKNSGVQFWGGLPLTILQAPIFGIFASCFFFLFTNFGWWVLSGMYPYSLQGLFACYVNGIPFFKTNLLGNLILTPLVFGAFFYLKKTIGQTSQKNLSSVLRRSALCFLKKYDFIRQRH